jgi:hypothetical protein
VCQLNYGSSNGASAKLGIRTQKVHTFMRMDFFIVETNKNLTPKLGYRGLFIKVMRDLSLK